MEKKDIDNKETKSKAGKRAAINLHAPKNLDVDNWFIECYKKHRNHPLIILIRLYKGNYHKFVLAVLFFLIKHCPVWILPIVTANIINDVTTGSPNTVRDIIIQCIVMVALIGLNIPTNYMYTRYKSLATRYAETGLRKALVRKLQQLSISYHKETQSGRLQSKIIRDVEAVETLSTQLLISTLNIALNIAISLAVTVTKSRMVFVFFLLTTPVAAVTMVFFRNVMRKRNHEFRHEMEETSAQVMEMVEMIPVTRAHALEEKEIDKISDQLFLVAEKGYRLDVIQSVFGSVGWAIFQVFQIVCLAFTGFLALRGTILPGDITLYQSYFATIVNQISSFVTLIPTIAKGVESVNSIGEVLLSDDIEKNDGKEKIDSLSGRYDFENVKFRYNNTDVDVINGLNLHVEPGETIALVGESGSGKSTILNLAIGFNLANEGKVLVDGKDIKELDLRSYRQFLAVVPQSSILFSGTLRDNITYGVDNVDDEFLQEVVEAANLSDLVESLPKGLNTDVGEHGGKLSGGQRQRVSIARALIRNPKVIILDEATSALDSISEKLIQEALDNLTRNRTTFIVAHRLSTIRNADKIAVINEGKCVEYGTYEELMELGGEFFKLKSIQS